MNTLNALGLAMLLAALVLAYLAGRHDGPTAACTLVGITAITGAYFAAAGAMLAL